MTDSVAQAEHASVGPQAWINGHFLGLADAKVGFFDAGFQHAIGLFETMLARDGAVLRLEAHLERLATSARELRLFDPLRVEPLAEAVQLALARSGLGDARIRITLTAGDLGKPFAGANDAAEKPAPPQPTVAIHVQPPTRYPDELFTNGVAVQVAQSRANPFDPFAGHKTLMYWPRIAAVQRAGEAGCAEALWFSVTGHLASGSVSSVFLVKDGRIRVPFARGEESASDGAHAAVPSMRPPVLPGRTRAAIILWAEGGGTGVGRIEVERAALTIEDVLAADELFLTNSSWGVMPVVRVERHTVGAGVPGPVARAMREKWLA
jgi:branched-subunit amino acid aminotransferase/4-amino-4-deoxychorismate lyase